MAKNKTKPWLLIPAYQPTEVLESLVSDLTENGFDHILIVNDGSNLACNVLFEKLATFTHVTVLHHAINLGKGAALKTGFNYFLLNAPNNILGIITVDADGQHTPEDVAKISNQTEYNADALLMGVRQFDSSLKVPLKSKLGNVITRNIFGLLSGKRLSDTQTGLRYLPKVFVYESLKINANGYEFELEMLIKAIARNLNIIEISIKTVYFDNNEHSHFNPLLDSIKIYFVFVRFLSTSIATAAIDYGVFFACYMITSNVLESLITGRIFAGSFNFLVAKNWVFQSHKKASLELPTYLLAVTLITLLSFMGIHLLTSSLGWSVISSKLVAEGVMFSVSFLAMRLFVFKGTDDAEPQKTNWDAYYQNPAPTARFTRKFTESLILKCFSKYSSNLSPSFCELGGARSCFFNAIREAYQKSLYTIIDNNQFGLNAFKNSCPDLLNVNLINANIENPIAISSLSDVTFSVGLIEHFTPEGTALAIKRHFEVTNVGGVVLLTFPTPTLLYSLTRKILEWLGLWEFPDERPLHFDEVRRAAQQYGKVLYETINWPIILTQGVMVVRKN